MLELFNVKELRTPLSESQRFSAAKKVIAAAQLGIKYCYKIKEAAGILHWSDDQMFEAIKYYRIDAVEALGMVRIPWWSLAEYLIDPADDVDKCMTKYLESIPHKQRA